MDERQGRRPSEFSWPFVAALFGLVVLSIVAMIGLGFALAWFAEAVA
ncbi:MAG TPA: hypothetical protein VNT58_07500 [Gaiellaceae bacterium]|nr:hypothetical protein [Gaiellaceae bacterium]